MRWYFSQLGMYNNKRCQIELLVILGIIDRCPKNFVLLRDIIVIIYWVSNEYGFQFPLCICVVSLCFHSV